MFSGNQNGALKGFSKKKFQLQEVSKVFWHESRSFSAKKDLLLELSTGFFEIAEVA